MFLPRIHLQRITSNLLPAQSTSPAERGDNTQRAGEASLQRSTCRVSSSFAVYDFSTASLASSVAMAPSSAAAYSWCSSATTGTLIVCTLQEADV